MTTTSFERTTSVSEEEQDLKQGGIPSDHTLWTNNHLFSSVILYHLTQSEMLPEATGKGKTKQEKKQEVQRNLLHNTAHPPSFTGPHIKY